MKKKANMTNTQKQLDGPIVDFIDIQSYKKAKMLSTSAINWDNVWKHLSYRRQAVAINFPDAVAAIEAETQIVDTITNRLQPTSNIVVEHFVSDDTLFVRLVYPVAGSKAKANR